MALKHAVLASLSGEESSGYGLSKRFDASVANFWPASAQQIYRELDRLEKEGLVTARTVKQEKRPDKRVFQITEEGRDELNEFIRRDTRPAVIRNDLLVKVAGLDGTNAPDVAAAVGRAAETSKAKLDSYEHLREVLLAGRGEEDFLSAGPGDPGLGPYLALKRGISFEKENLRWAREVLALLS